MDCGESRGYLCYSYWDISNTNSCHNIILLVSNHRNLAEICNKSSVLSWLKFLLVFLSFRSLFFQEDASIYIYIIFHWAKTTTKSRNKTTKSWNKKQTKTNTHIYSAFVDFVLCGRGQTSNRYKHKQSGLSSRGLSVWTYMYVLYNKISWMLDKLRYLLLSLPCLGTEMSSLWSVILSLSAAPSVSLLIYTS